MANLGLLVSLVGVVGSALQFAGVAFMDKVPVPHMVWPIAVVAGLVAFFVFRRAGD